MGLLADVIAEADLFDCATREISRPADASSVFETALPVLPLKADLPPVETGRPNSASAKGILESIETATQHALNGLAGGVVTNPISKAVLYSAGFAHPGHTEYLAAICEKATTKPCKPVMMLGFDSWALRSYALKPVERRTLHLPGSSMSQGKVELWVDVYTPNEAKTLPMIDIKPPAPEEFELRMIIWETKDIPMKTKDGETKLDMKVNVNFIGYEFIQSEGGTGQMNNRWDYALSYTEMVGMMNKQIEKAGHLAQDALIKYKNELGLAANPGYDKETDVHWWVKDGIGRFNYRMVWPCKYNCDMIEDKQMRLQFRVYDHDIATKDDMIGEAQIDLQPVLKAAFVHKERNTLLRIAEPWRIQDMLTSWKAFLFLRKDGHKVGELIVSLDVYGHLVAMIKPSGEGRSDPNQFPTLSEPRRRNWDEPPMYQGTGCCGWAAKRSAAAVSSSCSSRSLEERRSCGLNAAARSPLNERLRCRTQARQAGRRLIASRLFQTALQSCQQAFEVYCSDAVLAWIFAATSFFWRIIACRCLFRSRS